MVDFDKYYDHVGYDRGQLNNDIGRIKIDRTKKVETNHFCQMHDWTTVHWKAWKDEQLIEDSRTFEQGNPKVFQLGHF